ncbi:hypothetical protein EXIGLDRAFT_829143 [Exidia glandulosa HHB12029]|uniref:SNF2 N-terminal domain-containing protein n=1 Tax=Exidia glandulosa HHB12029 TaxID=1314781 RepID=A0A165PSQ5_EXIGL|nr:hypothetical protein EXIGLDRAFT_829143 [Exidia glandulosa HHB12029]
MSELDLHLAYVPASLNVPCVRCGAPIKHDVVAIGARPPPLPTHLWAHWTCTTYNERRNMVAVVAMPGYYELNEDHQRQLVEDVDVARFESPCGRQTSPNSCTVARNGPFTPLSGDLLGAMYYMSMYDTYTAGGAPASTSQDIHVAAPPSVQPRTIPASSPEYLERTSAELSTSGPVTPRQGRCIDRAPWRYSKPVTSPNNPFMPYERQAAVPLHSGVQPVSPVTVDSHLHHVVSPQQPGLANLSADDSVLQSGALARCLEMEQTTLTPGDVAREFWRAVAESVKMMFVNALTGARSTIAPTLGAGGVLQRVAGRDCSAVICALIWATKQRMHGPLVSGITLILVPKHALMPWKACLAKYPGLRVYVNAKRIPGVHELPVTDVVVTTFAALKSCESVTWERLVIDEGDFLLDQKALYYSAVQRLKARSRWMLPARPLDVRNEMQLRSLCAALHLFGSLSEDFQTNGRLLATHRSAIVDKIVV